MDDFFMDFVDDEFVKRQRQEAKNIKKSQWWKNKKGEGVCYYCKNRFKPQELTMDHIRPISRGGLSKKSNLVTACQECNFGKKSLMPVEMVEDYNSEEYDG